MPARPRVLLVLCAGCSWFSGPSGPPAETLCANGGDYTCWVEVPGATFQMGAQADHPVEANYDPAAAPDEGPVHAVTLPTFWIMRDEFAASPFKRCVERGVCSDSDLSTGGFSTWGDEGKRAYPVNGITWEGALKACGWIGGRLPTEAEWELAARGVEARRFPWGDDAACGVVPKRRSGLQGQQALGDDSAMAKPPCDNDGPYASRDSRGRSHVGATAMAGNVWEWTSDWYGPYSATATSSPTGPTEGTARVQRGGGWTSTDANELRSAARMSMPPDARMNDVGFRCVWSSK